MSRYRHVGNQVIVWTVVTIVFHKDRSLSCYSACTLKLQYGLILTCLCGWKEQNAEFTSNITKLSCTVCDTTSDIASTCQSKRCLSIGIP